MYQDLTIKSRIEMLPSCGSIKAHQLAIDEDGVLRQFGFDMKDEHPDIPQHLYFTDDEATIRDGDYWINLDDNSINTEGGLSKLANDAPSCIKIVASTNPELNLPQPSPDFIMNYILMYNKGEKIEYCMVLIDNRLTLEMEKGIDAPVNPNFNKPMVNKNNHIRET